MRRTALIITEDVVKIQGLTRILGKTYSRLYIAWLKLRLNLAILGLRLFYKVVVLTSNDIGFTNKDYFYYGNELSTINYAKNRQQYWAATKRLAKTINQPELTNLFITKLTIYLAYHYFIYADLYSELIDKIRPDRVFVLGQSVHEETAALVTRQRKIPLTKLTLFSFSWLQKSLQKWLLNREYQLKLDAFLGQSRLPKINPAIRQRSVLLSADFYRHLKSLMPLYRRLESLGEKPLLVTDINNLAVSLNNLYFSGAKHTYLASFLPDGFEPKNLEFNRSVGGQAKNLEDLFYQITLEAAEPMIKKSLLLGQLYLAAGKELFRELKPKGVVVVSDVRFTELTLAGLAKRSKAPSVLASPNTILDFTEINPYDLADKIAVVGPYIKKQLVRIGLNPKKIEVAGDLVAENVNPEELKLDRKKVFQKLGISEYKKLALLIFFRPTWLIPREEKEAYVKMAVAAAKVNPEVALVIKPHPTEKRYRVLEELKSWGIKDVVVSDNHKLSLMDLLHASSVVIQTWSFTIFEAIMLTRPVLIINPFKKDYGIFLPILSAKAPIHVHDQIQAAKWLKILVDHNHPKTIKQLDEDKKIAQQYIHFSKGEASQKVVAMLLGK